VTSSKLGTKGIRCRRVESGTGTGSKEIILDPKKTNTRRFPLGSRVTCISGTFCRSRSTYKRPGKGEPKVGGAAGDAQTQKKPVTEQGKTSYGKKSHSEVAVVRNQRGRKGKEEQDMLGGGDWGKTLFEESSPRGENQARNSK